MTTVRSSAAPDAAAAVGGHYDEVDATCPARDPAFREEFSVIAYEISEPSADVISALAERLDIGDYAGCDEVHSNLQPDRKEFDVRVVYSFADGAIATAG